MTDSSAQIKEDIVEGLKSIFGKDVKINGKVNEIVKDTVKKIKKMNMICNYIEFISASPRSMILRDNHNGGKLVEITLRDNRLWCSECVPKFCMHCTFSLLHPKFGELEDQDGN